MRRDGLLGPRVGLFSSQVPRELLYALGCIPVRVFPSAGKPTAAEAYLPRNFCSWSKLLLASFLENGQTDLDGVIFSDEDDATRRLHDVWRCRVAVPVWAFLETPRLSSDLAVDRYAVLLHQLGRDVEKRCGQSLDAEFLREAIHVYNQQRRLLDQLKRLWLEARLGTPSYRRLRRLAMTEDPVAANDRLSQALADQGNDIVHDPTELRLLLVAELWAPPSLVRLVEGHAARVVAEDSDLDEQSVSRPVPSGAGTLDGQLRNLARAYLLKAPGPRMRDLPRRLAHFTRLVEERRVDAAICAYGKFCDLHLAESSILKRHLEDLNVPTLILELEDETVGGQHRTRVEAFLEMVPRRLGQMEV